MTTIDVVNLACKLVDEVEFRSSNISGSFANGTSQQLQSIALAHTNKVTDEVVKELTSDDDFGTPSDRWVCIKAYNAMVTRVAQACADENGGFFKAAQKVVGVTVEDAVEPDMVDMMQHYAQSLDGKVKQLRDAVVCPTMAAALGKELEDAEAAFHRDSPRIAANSWSVWYFVGQVQYKATNPDAWSGSQGAQQYFSTLLPNQCFGKYDKIPVDELSSVERHALAIFITKLRKLHRLLKEIIDECPNGAWPADHTSDAGGKGVLPIAFYEKAMCIGPLRETLTGTQSSEQFSELVSTLSPLKVFGAVLNWLQQQELLMGTIKKFGDTHTIVAGVSEALDHNKLKFAKAVTLILLRAAQSESIADDCKNVAYELRYKLWGIEPT